MTLTDAALTLGGALVAGAAALWAGLLALGEEAAPERQRRVGEGHGSRPRPRSRRT